MSDDYVVGVDVGGTKTAIALVQRDGQVLAEDTIPTQPHDGVKSVLDRMAQGIQQIMQQADGKPLGIGVGCPGLVNFETGTSIFAVNMGADWRNIDVPAELSLRIGDDLPIWIENDVRAGGIGERYFGAAQDHENFVFVTIGTGLGGAAFVNGRLLHGVGFSAMEIGHAQAIEGGREADLGLHGTPEVYVSGKGFVASWQELKGQYSQSPLAQQTTVSTTEILNAAHAGDQLALGVIAYAAQALGTALSWCMTILNPSLVVIGGGLGKACGDLLLQPTRQIINQRILPANYEAVEFRLSTVETSALGPAGLVFYVAAQHDT